MNEVGSKYEPAKHINPFSDLCIHGVAGASFGNPASPHTLYSPICKYCVTEANYPHEVKEEIC